MAMRHITSFADGATVAGQAESVQDWSRAMNAAAASNETVVFDSKRYPIKSSVFVNADVSIDWRGTGHTEIIPRKDMAGISGNIFQFMSSLPVADGGRNTFRMEGFQIDCQEWSDEKTRLASGAPAEGSGVGLIDTYNYLSLDFHNNKLFGGRLEPTENSTIIPGSQTTANPSGTPYQTYSNELGLGQVDTLLGGHGNTNESITGNVFAGAYDCGLYSSGSMVQEKINFGGQNPKPCFKPVGVDDDRLFVQYVYTDSNGNDYVKPHACFNGERVYLNRALTIAGMNFPAGWYDVTLVEGTRYLITAPLVNNLRQKATDTGYRDRGGDSRVDPGDTIFWHAQQDVFARNITYKTVQFGANIRTVAAGTSLVRFSLAAHGLVTGQRILPNTPRDISGAKITDKWYSITKIDDSNFLIVADTVATAANVQVNSTNNWTTVEVARPGLPPGYKALVANNLFRFIANAASYKRSFLGVVYDNNKVTDCNNGLRQSNVDGGGNASTRSVATNNHLERIAGQPLAFYGGESIVSLNVVKDFGKRSRDWKTMSGGVVAAISLTDSIGSVVSANVIRNTGDWAAATWANDKGTIGVSLAYGAQGLGCWKTLVQGNTIEGVERPFKEGGLCGDNLYIAGTEVDCQKPAFAWSATTMCRQPVLADATGVVDPIKSLRLSVGATFQPVAAASVQNNSLFLNSADNRLSFKNVSGSVSPL